MLPVWPAIGFIGLAGFTLSQAAPVYSTFTIVARDAATGDLGVASCSRATAVGAVVPWVRAGAGAAADQAWVSPGLGSRLVDLMAEGVAPQQALTTLLEQDPRPERRQIGVVTAGGRAASHTGRETLAFAGAIEEPNLTVLGNLLAGRSTLEAMAAAFRSTEGRGLPLADRLLRSLEAGQGTGGDRRGSRSAALLTDSVDREPPHGRVVNLRVDDHDDPVKELRRIYDAATERLGYRVLSRPVGRDVAELQRLLRAAGFYDREPDGVYDDATVASVQAFRKADALFEGGQGGRLGLVDEELVTRLRAWVERVERKGRP